MYSIYEYEYIDFIFQLNIRFGLGERKNRQQPSVSYVLISLGQYLILFTLSPQSLCDCVLLKRPDLQ